MANRGGHTDQTRIRDFHHPQDCDDHFVAVEFADSDDDPDDQLQVLQQEDMAGVQYLRERRC